MKWDGVECRPCTTKPQTAELQKVKLVLSLIFGVGDSLGGILEKDVEIVSSFLK